MTDGIRIKDLPANERPRERLAELGAQALRDAELIAILLRTGTKGRSAVQIADELVLRNSARSMPWPARTKKD